MRAAILKDRVIIDPCKLTKEEKISQSLKEHHAQPELELRATKVRQLFIYLRDEKDNSVENMSAATGISVPAIYKYLDINEAVSPRDSTLEPVRQWLVLPRDVFYRFFTSEDMSPIELMAYCGLEEEIPENRRLSFESALDLFAELELSQQINFINRCNSVLADCLARYTHEIAEKPKIVDLTAEQRVRLKNLLQQSMLLQSVDEDALKAEIGFSAIVPNILELNEDYAYPESEVIELVPYLFQVFDWTEEGLPIVNPSKRLDSLEGLLEALDL